MTAYGNTSMVDALSPHSKAHRERATLMARLWNYYRGRHAKPLVVKPGQADDNVTLNFSRRVVDKGLAFLFGPGVEFEMDGSDAQTPAEEHLGQVWGTSEQRRRTLLDLGLNGAIAGTAFLRIYPAAQPDALPRLAVIDSALMDVVANVDDLDDVRAYMMLWRAGALWKRHRVDLQENGQWLISEEEMERSNQWRLVNETAWEWTFPPVFMCQNLPHPNDVWGISDLEEADINDAINWTASNINRILRFHAHPKTIGLGFRPDKLQNTAIDQFWSVDEKDAKVFNLEMQSDLASAYQMLQALKETYAKVSGVPSLDPDKINVGQLSGFALRILYGDLLEKTNVKRVTYGALLADVNAALLALGGYGEGLRVNCVWGDPLPVSTAEEVQGLTADRANGLSLETYLERRGYDAERELARIAEEKQGNATLGEALLRSFETAPL
jgi:hypothetical protein